MPRGEHLSSFEKGQIDAFKAIGFSERKIAERIVRSKTAVHNYLSAPAIHGSKNRSGRPPKLSARDKRRIIRMASNSTVSTRIIRDNLNLQVHPDTVRRVLVKSPYLVHCRMRSAPALKDIHKQKRLTFARNNMRTDWKSVRSITLVYFFNF